MPWAFPDRRDQPTIDDRKRVNHGYQNSGVITMVGTMRDGIGIVTNHFTSI
jgi:hypothetical protein